MSLDVSVLSKHKQNKHLVIIPSYQNANQLKIMFIAIWKLNFFFWEDSYFLSDKKIDFIFKITLIQDIYYKI
jgi:hypothetical protein